MTIYIDHISVKTSKDREFEQCEIEVAYSVFTGHHNLIRGEMKIPVTDCIHIPSIKEQIRKEIQDNAHS